jgi:hypothetical protein
MNKNTLRIIVALSFLALITPFCIYFYFFNGPISNEDANWANFGTFIGGILSSIFSFTSFIVLIYTLLQDKETKRKEIYFEYLKLVNIFAIKINDLLSTIVNIDKYSRHLLGHTNVNFFIVESLNDYFSVINKIDNLHKYLETNKNNYNVPNTNNKIYFDILMRDIIKVINPNIFIEICSEFENNSCNYYYLIKQSFRQIYKNIIKYVQFGSFNSMKDFDIQKLKIDLNEYVYQINEEILGKKLDRNKDIFDT